MLKMAGDLDNLEYYIKFPSPNFNYNQQNGESDYVFVVNEEKIPVILLFGWAGCQDKYLAKYSQIYEDRGLITLRYTAPVKCLFWKRLQMITIGEKLVKLLTDLNFENHPIIIHCFSNGGAFLYQNFSLALEKSPKPIEIKGVIFDSAPGKRRILSLFRAISAILGGKPVYNIPMSVLMTMFLSMIWLYEVISNYINPKSTFQSNPLENLKNEKNSWPQHFIYSKKDVLIPFTDIEYFANYRKTLGVDVTSLCYEDSPHVKHYSEHKESYVNSPREMQKHVETCAESTKADITQLETTKLFLEEPKKEILCLAKCLLEAIKVVDSDGMLATDVLGDYSKDMPILMRDKILECKEEVEPIKECEDMEKYRQCLLPISMKLFNM